jgi:uroporphyrin-3 C-methyltransferase
MSDAQTEKPAESPPLPAVEPAPRKAGAARPPRLALFIAVLALAGTAAQWYVGRSQVAADRSRAEETSARLQRRLNTLEDRIRREREDLDRLAERIGSGTAAEDSLAGRIAQLEEAIARLPGADRVRLSWRIEQAEYFMRVAIAQETFAGDSAGALTALTIADEHLRDAADPRLLPVRKLLAADIAALRAVPRVDTEGLILKLTALAGEIPKLPLRQVAPDAFASGPGGSPEGQLTGTERALAELRRALGSIVSVRRTDTPAPTLLSEESVATLVRGVELELQMARLALLRGSGTVYRTSLANVREALERYFDTATAEGASALELVDELAKDAPPESRPDISGALTELLRLKERELQP